MKLGRGSGKDIEGGRHLGADTISKNAKAKGKGQKAKGKRVERCAGFIGDQCFYDHGC